jgi:hypothetical protein
LHATLKELLLVINQLFFDSLLNFSKLDKRNTFSFFLGIHSVTENEVYPVLIMQKEVSFLELATMTVTTLQAETKSIIVAFDISETGVTLLKRCVTDKGTNWIEHAIETFFVVEIKNVKSLQLVITTYFF